MEVKQASWNNLLMFRESEDELNRGVYVTRDRWAEFLTSVKAGQFQPVEAGDGLIEITISDFPPSLLAPRSVYTTEANWAKFVTGVRQGLFDKMADYPRTFA